MNTDCFISLELSARLDELGVKNTSLYSYGISESKTPPQKLFAYTASDLLFMLPTTITTKEDDPFNNFRFMMTKATLFEGDSFKTHYLINYKCDSTETAGINAWLPRNLLQHNIHDASLTNAAAKTLIHLIENGYVKNGY